MTHVTEEQFIEMRRKIREEFARDLEQYKPKLELASEK
jgi:hypothetical protein